MDAPWPRSSAGFALAIAALVVAGAAATACAPPFDFAPWLLPVPEGTRTIGLHAVSDDERRAVPPIEMTSDLVIGGDAGDFDYMFGSQPPRIAVGDDGRVAVLDGGNHRVQVFDPGGRLLATMGTEGQGPGELRQPLTLLAEPDALVVYDVVNLRVTRWSWDGELIASARTQQWGALVVQVGDDELVWRANERRPDATEVAFRRVAQDGTVRAEYARLPWPERVIDPPLGEIVGTEPDAWWVGTVPPTFTTTAAGDVVVSPLSDYQLFAYAPDGMMRWALQAAHPRPPIDSTEIDYFMELHARRFPERSAAQVAWPETQYALADVRVDGHGHLYVFPYVPKGTATDVPRPVDVYSADGDLLYRGTINSPMFSTIFSIYNGPMLEVSWQAARDNTVWGLMEDETTGERRVARFALREPF